MLCICEDFMQSGPSQMSNRNSTGPVTFKRGICLPREYQIDEVSKGHDWLIEIPSPAETTFNSNH